MHPRELLAEAQQLLPEQLLRLQQLVELETPTENSTQINRAITLIQGWSAELKPSYNLNKMIDFGDILEITFGAPKPSRKPILLLGHLDTVWPLGTLETMPWKTSDNRLSGPGVLDMKAGVLMALTACKILITRGISFHSRLLLNSEEEVGSPVSRPITERLALESEAVFVVEPAQGLAYKTARKGIGNYRIDVEGVASHSGVDFYRGHSAVVELARLIESTSNLTDATRNRTVNCGVIAGGTRSNVVAEHARCDIDVRVATMADAAEVDRLLHNLPVTDPGCSLKVTGGINRPPMERSTGTAALFGTARRLASEMGFELDEASTGGGSDGNFTAALGVPTLDGMGAVGGGAHAADEHILLEHLAPRTALLAAMIATVSRDGV